MEVILLIIVSANLAATCWFGIQLSKREEYRVEFIPIDGEQYAEWHVNLDNEPEPEEQKEAPQPEAPAQETKAKVSYSAWENRKNIPWVESNRPNVTPPVSLSKEPLARPDGFV